MERISASKVGDPGVGPKANALEHKTDVQSAASGDMASGRMESQP